MRELEKIQNILAEEYERAEEVWKYNKDSYPEPEIAVESLGVELLFNLIYQKYKNNTLTQENLKEIFEFYEKEVKI